MLSAANPSSNNSSPGSDGSVVSYKPESAGTQIGLLSIEEVTSTPHSFEFPILVELPAAVSSPSPDGILRLMQDVGKWTRDTENAELELQQISAETFKLLRSPLMSLPPCSHNESIKVLYISRLQTVVLRKLSPLHDAASCQLQTVIFQGIKAIGHKVNAKTALDWRHSLTFRLFPGKFRFRPPVRCNNLSNRSHTQLTPAPMGSLPTKTPRTPLFTCQLTVAYGL